MHQPQALGLCAHAAWVADLGVHPPRVSAVGAQAAGRGAYPGFRYGHPGHRLVYASTLGALGLFTGAAWPLIGM